MKNCLFIFISLFWAGFSSAQIVHYYNGGLTYFGMHSLDMDNNGYPEYNFWVSSQETVVGAEGNNCLAKGANLVYFYANQTIGSSTNWECSSGVGNYVEYSGETRILGLKFYLNGQVHYGWVKVDPNPGGSYVLWEWAYNATPGTSIPAGATSFAGVENVQLFEGKTLVWNGILTIESPQGNLENVSLHSLSGQKLYENNTKGSSVTIDVSAFASGVYLLRIGDRFKKIVLP